jgi:hypothetical protein
MLIKTHRLHPFQKARTSSSETSFVSLLHSTVRFVMTRTKPAKTADKLVIANTIAQRSRTSPPTSSVVSVATQVTWRVIVQIANVVKTGATVLLLVVLVPLSLLATPIKITRHLWAVSAAMQAPSKLHLAAMLLQTTDSSHGSALLQAGLLVAVVLLLGPNQGEVKTEVARRPGPTTIVATMAMAVAVAEDTVDNLAATVADTNLHRLLVALHLGLLSRVEDNNLVMVMADTVATIQLLLLLVALLRGCNKLRVATMLLLPLHHVSIPFYVMDQDQCSNTLQPMISLHPLHRHIITRHHLPRLHRWILRRSRNVVISRRICAIL